MICLGIESTAHSFSIGIIDDKGKVYSCVTDMYKTKEGFGLIPHELRKHHESVSNEVLEKALKIAKFKIEDIDMVAFSQGPGLPPALKVGFELTKSLKKPIIGVNHCIAHIEIGKLFTKLKDPVTLYVSGANTQIIAFVSGKYRIFGETQDIGIGNALDKLGRNLGLEFPAGPKIEQLAKKGKYIELPYTVKGMDLSFSGILTDAMKKVEKEKKPDICYSFQENCFAMLTEVTERALAHTGKNEVLLTGGVAANKRLQNMLNIMCKERGARFAVCPREYSGDNGVNIAWLGILYHRSGIRTESDIFPRQRTDDIDIKWL